MIIDDSTAVRFDPIIEPLAGKWKNLPHRIATLLDDRFGLERRRAVEDAMRSPDVVMTPEALSTVKASSLSFSQSMIEQISREGWIIGRPNVTVDEQGRGHMVYRVVARAMVFSFVVLTSWDGLEKAGRRMDHTADFIGSLLHGDVSPRRLADELAAMGSPNWTGRTDALSFGMTAANRSQRLFDYTVGQLVDGKQPSLVELAEGGGYLVRNAGFYGNGRAGSASWASIPSGHPFETPYHLDLFLLYLWRLVGPDFADAVAFARSTSSVRLSDSVRKYLGVGNSSGLGMTCALVRWPQWVGTWCLFREIAIAYAATDPAQSRALRTSTLITRLTRAIEYYEETVGPQHGLRGHAEIAKDLRRLLSFIATLSPEDTWADVLRWSYANLLLDATEQLNSFLIDLHPECSEFLRGLIAPEMRRTRQVAPEMTIGELKEILVNRYRWALDVDRSTPEKQWHFWYHSEEAGEQRRGERLIDAGSEFETFVDVIGAIQECDYILRTEDWREDDLIAHFLLSHPDQAYTVSRIQLAADEPFGELRGNLVEKNFKPIQVIRFFLSVLGFESGVPKSISWVQGVLLQGAPLPQQLRTGKAGEWTMPTIADFGKAL